MFALSPVEVFFDTVKQRVGRSGLLHELVTGSVRPLG